jgi:CHAT domain-containing protein
MYLAENEKKTYVFATHITFSLYKLTREHSYVRKMYNIAKKGKAAVLHNEIAGNELFRSVGLPDSLGLRRKKLDENIAAFKKSIFQEMHSFNPDSGMITIWKDALFEMNRESEKLAGQMKQNYPQYHNLLERTEPASINEIQANLDKDETVIDYFLSNEYDGGIRDLYIFLIAKDRLDLRYVRLDPSFQRNAEIIRSSNSGRNAGIRNENFKSYTYALWYMYDNLIRPVEELKPGSRLIIIPDEQITWLPFDAFLRHRPESDQAGYESLSYLIYDYTFSYGYSSSLIFSEDIRRRRYRVYAFSPDYGNQSFQGRNLNSLRGTGEETEQIYKWFRGKKYTGAEATESNFRKAIQYPAIFHLAMHSVSDTIDSKYSCLVFDSQADSVEDGNLYNYEIGMNRVISPMVVLSACNSGSGTLYHGEGLMSLARGFTLAGASSVIKTAWEVNDETSVAVITRFYFHLSRGKNKDEALRQAKLEYLNTQPPVYTNPYYWAAYEVLGDNSPVLQRRWLLFIPVSAVCIVMAGGLIIYFRRRTIFSAGRR